MTGVAATGATGVPATVMDATDAVAGLAGTGVAAGMTVRRRVMCPVIAGALAPEVPAR